jgi:hypothetical protein
MENEKQTYFVYAQRGDQGFRRDFQAISRSDAEEQMRQYVLSQLYKGADPDLATWQFLVRTKDEEETLRSPSTSPSTSH